MFWRGLPAAPLPDYVVKRYDNNTIAITGYEQDQVVVEGEPGANPEKDKRVPSAFVCVVYVVCVVCDVCVACVECVECFGLSLFVCMCFT